MVRSIEFPVYCKVLLLAAVSIGLSGCLFQKKAELPNSDWQKEILMSQECGLDGLSCCKDGRQACDGGLSCCFNPDGSGQNYCSESCESGKLGKFCRVGESRCDSGLSCVDSLCVECGIAGNPCCEGKCKTESSETSDHAECFDGICRSCGTSENRACLDNDCLPYNLLNNDICYPCGGYNQPCCQVGSSTEYECDASLKLRCRLGFCSE